MLNHLPRDLEHIRYLSCEDIQIFPEKSDEREFLFDFQVCVDPKLLVQVDGVDWDFLFTSPLLLPVRWLISGLLVGR
jgi:hypothetical protein